ncbi:hypothetical protein STEG23_037056, partial [Scotinomys teguina]
CSAWVVNEYQHAIPHCLSLYGSLKQYHNIGAVTLAGNLTLFFAQQQSDKLWDPLLPTIFPAGAPLCTLYSIGLATFSYPGFFVLPYEVENCFFQVCEELSWDFDGDCIESVDSFWNVPCIPTLSKAFIMKGCWILSNAFSASNEMIMCRYISIFISNFIDLDALSLPFALSLIISWHLFLLGEFASSCSRAFSFDLVDLSIGWNLPSSAFCKAGFVDRSGLFMLSQISWTLCVMTFLNLVFSLTVESISSIAIAEPIQDYLLTNLKVILGPDQLLSINRYLAWCLSALSNILTERNYRQSIVITPQAMLLNPEQIQFGTVISLNRATLLSKGEAEAAVEHNCLVGLMIEEDEIRADAFNAMDTWASSSIFMRLFKDNTATTTKSEDGHYVRTDYAGFHLVDLSIGESGVLKSPTINVWGLINGQVHETWESSAGPGWTLLRMQSRQKNIDDGTSDGPYSHALVAGIDRCHGKVTVAMGKKKIR